MGVNRKAKEGAIATVDCPTDKYWFDRDRGNALMEEFVNTGVPSSELLAMVNKLFVKLTQHNDYKYYSDIVKEELISQATYEFLKYSHTFKASKARNGAYTFLTWNCRNAFNRYLKSHYKHENTREWLSSAEMIDTWSALTAVNLIDEELKAEDECMDSYHSEITKSFACKTVTQNLDIRESGI